MFWKNVKHLPGTIVFQLVASLALTNAVLLIILSSFLFWLFQWQVNQDNNQFLDDVTTMIEAELKSQDNILPILERRIPRALEAFRFNRYQIRILSTTHPQKILLQSTAFPVQIIPTLEKLPVYNLDRLPGDGKVVQLPDGTSYLALAVKAQTGKTHPGTVIIHFALDVTSKIKLLQLLQVNLFFFTVLGTLLLSVLGIWNVRKGLYPLMEFSERILEIRMDVLDQRIQSKSWPNELQPLARSFDRLIARLQKNVEQISRYSGDLAHELRTPLTNLRVEIEVLLEKPRTLIEYQATLENNLLELERLSTLVDRILLLSRMDHAQFEAQWQTFPVRQLAEKLLDFYSLLAEEKKLSMRVEGELLLHADAQLVEQALGNLLSNAIKYTQETGEVTIALAAEVNAEGKPIGMIRVFDNGPGISEEQAPYVFERFYRGDSSRSQLAKGDGLGLALVKSIMEIHGGTVGVQPVASGGTCMTLCFENQFLHR